MPEDQINYIAKWSGRSQREPARGLPRRADCYDQQLREVRLEQGQRQIRLLRRRLGLHRASTRACNSPSAHAVGVYMNATHRWLFSGVFGNTVTLTDKSVMN